MLAIVNNGDLPGPFLPLVPLAADHRCVADVVLGVLNWPNCGFQLGGRDALAQGVLVRTAGALEHIGCDFIGGILISQGLVPLFLGALFISVAQSLAL